MGLIAVLAVGILLIFGPDTDDAKEPSSKASDDSPSIPKHVQTFQVGYLWGEYDTQGLPHLNVEFLFWNGSEWSSASKLVRTDATIEMRVSEMCCGDYYGRDDWTASIASPINTTIRVAGPNWHHDPEFGDSYYHHFDAPRVRCNHSYQVEATALLADGRTMSHTRAEWIKVTDCDE